MAQLTRKSYQRKAAAIGFGIFLTSSLAATGFAAWAIASTAKAEVIGDVDVFTVVDKSISIVLDPFTDLNTGVIKFEPKEDDTTGRVRNDGKNFENLGFDISGSIAPFEYVSSFTIQLDLGRVSIDPVTKEEVVVIDEAAEERFEAAAAEVFDEENQMVRGSFITLPDCWRKPVDVEEVNERRDPVRFSHHIEFGWGTEFNGMNPGEYFDLRDDGGEEFLVSDEKMRETLFQFYSLMTDIPEESVTEQEKEQGYIKLHYVITIIADTSGSHEESEDFISSVEGGMAL